MPPPGKDLLIGNRIHLVIHIEEVPNDVLEIKDARLVSYAHENLRVNSRRIRRVLNFIWFRDQGEAEDPAHAAHHRENVDERQVLAHRVDLDEAVNITGANYDQ